ncbi:cytochrome P450 [Gordonia sp. Z-3]|uniref:cytochrome P450 n=1 Tax=unclassified Gordonia (in: high G+C Gram-positive bacteria) TaxID=2657482 RepID=UPI000C446C5A|nr:MULTISPECIES: cytochrome P450 [unclassified Gordonia (in: high G+C Gram-positive bacteria)]MAU82575.1 cytochrome P450 [Gordonia sp. (in: high G+C Gram-positive bacteria)]MED5803260.1 cytochrome P450 [Gordonia sp. Z-3]
MHDLDNPYPYYETLRTDTPVARLADSPFYVVTSWDLIAEAVARPDHFSSNLTATMVWNADGTVTTYPIAELDSPIHALATADDPAHRDHRRMVMPSLVAKRIGQLEPFIDHTVKRLWDSGIDSNGIDGNRIDWMTAVAHRVPMAVVAELLGFPTYDIDDLIRWSFATTVLLDGVVTAEQLTAATQAATELGGHIAESFTATRDDPGGGVMGDLATLVNRGDLDESTAIIMLIQLVAAGAESTVSLLGNAVWLLGEQPELVGQLRDNRDLVRLFVEEALRVESPFRGHYRHVVHDTTLGDVALPANSHLYLMWGAANRDAEHFDEPDRVNLDPAVRRPHMAFGKGLHLCVGAALARLEARVAVNHLLDATTDFTVHGANPQWERSLLVRRLRTLPLTVT